MKLKIENFDWLTFLPALIISFMSIALIYSAKHASVSGVERMLFVKQGIWVVLGLIAFYLTYRLPVRTHEILAYLYYALGLTLLAALFLIGSTNYGSTRWFNLGPFNVQPSEIMKLAVIVALARFLAYPKKITNNFIWVIVAVFFALAPMLLVLKQPDLGTSSTFLIILLSLLFWSGLSIYFLVLLVSPILSLILAFHWLSWGIFFGALLTVILRSRPGRWLGTFVVMLNLSVGIVTPIVWNNLHDYQKDRIFSFLDPNKDKLGSGYQLIQSKVAIGSGGLLGKGYLNSSQARLEFLPMQHTDFIYSVLGEEFGLAGCSFVLALLSIMVYRGVRIALRARNNFAGFLAWGISAVLAFQSSVNIGMTLGLLPVTGIPLPFVSYGGSAMIVNWAMWGIVLNISANWQEY
ncbi:MAG: rod shape-determining protein RodA [candidate division Zixibacteria bacterium RBG_16_50_21]|nr:MAG: rod shape-determining protein RodA [candidate division Zixibacteria bacterium RBG_16_50_21]